MKTLYYSHSDFLYHDTGKAHPECADRIRSINQALQSEKFNNLIRVSPPKDPEIRKKINLIHTQKHIDNVMDSIPSQGHEYLDGDTVVSVGSGTAACAGVSALCDAVDKICHHEANHAFCAVRPPGHHATPDKAMGFCLFNSIAIAAEYARKQYQLNRIAIVDFDVHHGNGTQAAFIKQPEILYISSHEMPNFPGTGYPDETGVGNIINLPLEPGTSGATFRKIYTHKVFPALRKFDPQLMLISAGFDAHKDDPLASIELHELDFNWVTCELAQIAKEYCQGRLISALEGGYNLTALSQSVAAHVSALLEN